MMGDVLQESGNLESAADQYMKALFYKPERDEVVCNLLANVLFSLENYTGAITYYKKVIDHQGIPPDWKSRIAAERFANRYFGFAMLRVMVRMKAGDAVSRGGCSVHFQLTAIRAAARAASWR